MVHFKNKEIKFDEVTKSIREGNVSDYEEFIIEALRAFFYTEDGMTVVDANGITILNNSAHEKIMGVDGDNIVGKSTEELVKEGIIQKSASSMVFESHEQETMVQNLSNGKTVLVTATPLFDQSKNIDRIINNVRDVPILQSMYEESVKQLEIISSYKSELAEQRYLSQKKLVAESMKMRQVLKFAERLAANDSTVLILGESGVGKGVIARLIQDMSGRNSKPMISVNCGAIPEHLLESELFGYVGGAFTGANKDGKIGLIEAANGGVVFLDEIGELPVNVQPKLLSFLETGEVMKVGSTKAKKVDCRIIAATNRNLDEMVEKGEFREDLFYRLSVIPIKIPPLRERREDIVPLILEFLKEINEKNNSHKTMSKELLRAMEKAEWTGNVRQLHNMVERLVVLSTNTEITISDLPNDDVYYKGTIELEEEELPISLPDIIKTIEDKYIEQAMKEGGSIRRAATLLGMTPSTLFRKINRQ